MNKANRYEIFARFQRQNPNPQTELNYSSDFELLVAVILSAQATDISVNKVTALLFKVANTPQQFLDLGEAQLCRYTQHLNYYKTKSKNIISCCHTLIQSFQGQVPRDRAQLQTLAGVGRKTANVVLSELKVANYIAVDTHVFRVSNRTGIAKGTSVLEVEVKLEKNVPQSFKSNAHHWLLLHGRYVCKARKPLCYQCLINDLCDETIHKKILML